MTSSRVLIGLLGGLAVLSLLNLPRMNAVGTATVVGAMSAAFARAIDLRQKVTPAVAKHVTAEVLARTVAATKQRPPPARLIP